MSGAVRNEIPLDEISNQETAGAANYWAMGLFIFAALILVLNLGSAALFEPDEGRNGEIAREILLLNDWVTPHYDFLPRLDKPIAFFNLVALSFKLFGVSEWSARLPSASAALVCLFLTYGFARLLFGLWAGLWSGMILLTSMQFFIFSRIVILDMTLTLFMSIALGCFMLGQLTDDRNQQKVFYLLMYPAMGVATLLKGPVGFMLPGMIIFSYLLSSQGWGGIRELKLPLGILLFVLTAAPWYVLAEIHNPGYLQHFLWTENVARFTTTQFNRTGPWYYFIAVLTAGFFPWTVLVPLAITDFCKRSLTGQRLFLILWMALPLLFFSLSLSKLPQYILPIYPPLAVMVGSTIAKALTESSAKRSWAPRIPAVIFILLSCVITLVPLWPEIFTYRLQTDSHATFSRISIAHLAGGVLILILALLAYRRHLWAKQNFLYPATGIGFALFILFAEPIVTAVSFSRSSKQLAKKAAPYIRDDDQLVLYGGYPSSLPFYLSIQRPIWAVWSGTQSRILGSDYVALKRPEAAAIYGKVMYTQEEFLAQCKSTKKRLMVFVDSGAIPRFERSMGTAARVLFQVDNTALVERCGSNGAHSPQFDHTRIPIRAATRWLPR
jgi:hypothetical protein